MAKNPILLVEGIDDASVIGNLLNENGFKTLRKSEQVNDKETDIIIRDKGSDRKVLNSLKDEIKTADRDKQPGDAVANRWASVIDRLRAIGYINLPMNPDPNGTIVEAEIRDAPTDPNLPRCGIWIMPDNSGTGKLEDFVKQLIPPERNDLWLRANRVVREIPASERLFNELDEIKAHIHTFLAWQSRPGVPMGTAIGAKYLLADTPEVQRFLNWVRNLFVLLPG